VEGGWGWGGGWRGRGVREAAAAVPPGRPGHTTPHHRYSPGQPGPGFRSRSGCGGKGRVGTVGWVPVRPMQVRQQASRPDRSNAGQTSVKRARHLREAFVAEVRPPRLLDDPVLPGVAVAAVFWGWVCVSRGVPRRGSEAGASRGTAWPQWNLRRAPRQRGASEPPPAKGSHDGDRVRLRARRPRLLRRLAVAVHAGRVGFEKGRQPGRRVDAAHDGAVFADPRLHLRTRAGPSCVSRAAVVDPTETCMCAVSVVR
jgi:hypothetical protein